MRISDWSSDVCSSDLLDVSLDLLRRVHRAVALDHFAALVDQELREVPLDALCAQHAWRGGLQVLVERVRVGAVDIDLREHREVDFIGQRAEILYLVFIARLLMRSEEHTSELQSLMRISSA